MKKCSSPALAIVALILAWPTAVAALPLFGAHADFATGSAPYSVAIGDLNGDGIADLAVASGVGASVLLNNGGGNFGAKTDFVAGSSPSFVAIGDLNGDGKLDLVVANSTSSTVSVLLGVGDGSFSARTDFATGSAPIAVAIGDLNGDGKPDLAVANFSSNSVSVLIGNGDGSFAARTDFATGNSPAYVAIAHLNADGIPDLATANYTSSSVTVLLGAGSGVFGAKTDFATGGFPLAVAIGDLNGDGKADMATANYVSNTASVLPGNGDGTFGSKSDYATGNRPRMVAIGDLDGDGHADLATANYTSNSVSVLLGNGGGTFAVTTDFATGAGPYSLAIGDLDGDGKPDMAIASSGANTVSVLLRQFLPSITSLGSSPRPSLVGDNVTLTASVTPTSASGTVTFRNGPDSLGIATLSGGVATLSVSGLCGGSYSLSASYTGDTSYHGSTSPALAHVVDAAPTTVTMASSLNPSLFAQPVSFTATVSDAVSTACARTGSVAFVIDGVPFGPPVALAGGSATLAGITSFATGPHSVQAVYDGNASFLGSTSPAITQSVLPHSSATLLSSSPNPSQVGNIVTLTASVTPTSASGTVTFRNGPDSLGTATLSGGVAALPVSGLCGGSQSLSATYVGDAGHTSSTSPSLAHIVNAAPTTVTVASSLNPSLLAQPVSFTATVSDAAASACALSGSVEFVIDGAPFGAPVALAGGSATLAGVASLAIGPHSVHAVYDGNASFLGGTSPEITQSVVPHTSTTLLSSSPNPSLVGNDVTLTASVTPASASGTVTFHNGTDSLGTATLSGGVATLSVSGLCGGSYSLAATYVGDAGRTGSTSPAHVHVVHAAPTTVIVASSLNPSLLTQPVSFTATVSTAAASACALSGSVEFVIDGAPFGAPVALAGGSATLAGVGSLAIGPHSVHAVYDGNASFLGSTSPAITQVVSPPSPGIVGVRDIVNDQGGRVKLLWNASYMDLAPFNSIESYWVLRSAPALVVARAKQAGARIVDSAGDPQVGAYLALQQQGATYFWEFIASQPAFHVPNYSYVAATTRDSVAGSNPLTAFMIQARTAGGAQSWFSDPDSGYSVDNLAPHAPAPFMGAYASGVATLHWGASPEADLDQYQLHRGITASFVPGPGNLVVTQRDTIFADAVGASYYYKLCALDVHGNASGYTPLLPSGTTDAPRGMSLAFALEGMRPNPSHGEALSVGFTLPLSAPARLELVDVSGRRVVEREVGALGAGRHWVDLAAGRRFAPGLYMVRLTQGANVRVTRIAVLK